MASVPKPSVPMPTVPVPSVSWVPMPSGSTLRRSWQLRQPLAFQKLAQGQQAGAEGGPSSPRGAVGGHTAGDVGLAAGGEGLGDWGRGRRNTASARARSAYP
jgi:hypothetical protein